MTSPMGLADPRADVVSIEIWSDFVCPWCYIAHRGIEQAVQRAGAQAQITYCAYQLHPRAPSDVSLPIREFWKTAYPGTTREASDNSLVPIIAAGREVGLDLNYDVRESTSASRRR